MMNLRKAIFQGVKHRTTGLMSQLFTKQQNFRPVQIESICRRHFKWELKIEICFGKGRKLVEKVKMLVSSIFFFSHKIFKSFLYRVVMSRLCGKGLTWKNKIIKTSFLFLRLRAVESMLLYLILGCHNFPLIQDTLYHLFVCKTSHCGMPSLIAFSFKDQVFLFLCSCRSMPNCHPGLG